MFQGQLLIPHTVICKVLSEIHDKRGCFIQKKKLADVHRKVLVAKDELNCSEILSRVCGVSKGKV